MRPPRANNPYRDTWSGTLTGGREGEQVRVAGWVHRRRDHGGLVFIDLRDRSGLVQLVFHPDQAPEAHREAGDLRSEDVIAVVGPVTRRDPENVNPALPTGEIEITVLELHKLADAQTPPFPIDEDTPVEELLRLRYRPLDLRRENMQHNITLRHDVARDIRTHLYERDFLEIETPMLTRSTPEGARDYLVPARLAPGSFYALPQSPQLFKELLMFAGYERYFQIVRCFRDEDPRADRQPEFTQLDMEMSFVDEEDVIETIEGLMSHVFNRGEFTVPDPPWPRLGHDEAVLRYGTDRPDTRFGLQISDVSDLVRGSEFKVFESVLAAGGVVRAINAGPREMSRAEQDQLNEIVQVQGAKAVAPMPVTHDGWGSNLAKFFSPDQIASVNQALDAKDGDLLLFVADKPAIAAKALGDLRLRLAERFDLIPTGRHDVRWIVDFPMFEWNEGEKRWDPLHHPFTAPAMADRDAPLSFQDPAALRSRAYDLVVDGWELGGGSIRINTPEVQREVLKLVGISEQEADQRFGFLLEAMRYGAPPLGGIAFGLDRIVAVMAGQQSIREVIAFPKTATGADPLTGAPAPVDPQQLRELGLRLAEKPASS